MSTFQINLAQQGHQEPKAKEEDSLSKLEEMRLNTNNCLIKPRWVERRLLRLGDRLRRIDRKRITGDERHSIRT
jgi:hypothetical protein